MKMLYNVSKLPVDLWNTYINSIETRCAEYFNQKPTRKMHFMISGHLQNYVFVGHAIVLVLSAKKIGGLDKVEQNMSGKSR